ncbi:MAG: HEAT repeat domain-containing protein [Coleofasciculaceae cyanobacterium SM2_1_6]|nr:HEAT repeat domain-containing protein [Coleofasciculaceae cyanobacterium SM2_1_6]
MRSKLSITKPLSLESALENLRAGNFQQRWEAAKEIPKFGSRSIEPLTKFLHHPEQELRWFATRILGEINHPQSIDLLVELLATPEEELRAIAAKSLAQFGEQTIPALAAKLSQPATRLLAVQALSQIYSEEVVVPLLSVITDVDATVRSMAIAALHSYESPEIIPALIQGLTDPAALVRREATIGLGLLASRTPTVGAKDEFTKDELVKFIAPRLADLNLEVAQQAAIALRRVNTEAAVKILGEFLLTEPLPPSFQLEILQQLGWMDQPAALDYLQWGLDHGAPHLWLEIVTILGRVEVDKPRACDLLGQLLTSNHPAITRSEIRQAIAASLGQLGEVAGRKILTQLLSDGVRSVQLHSQFALSLLPAVEANF